jgi:hypothetical protein
LAGVEVAFRSAAAADRGQLAPDPVSGGFVPDLDFATVGDTEKRATGPAAPISDAFGTRTHVGLLSFWPEPIPSLLNSKAQHFV